MYTFITSKIITNIFILKRFFFVILILIKSTTKIFSSFQYFKLKYCMTSHARVYKYMTDYSPNKSSQIWISLNISLPLIVI